MESFTGYHGPLIFIHPAVSYFLLGTVTMQQERKGQYLIMMHGDVSDLIR